MSRWTGAPIGALLLRLAVGADDPMEELRANSFFYFYALIGTCLVFGVAGFYAGRRADRLRRSRDRFHLLAERDDLTHLSNARAFRNRYRRAIEHAATFREPISFLIVDVDGLKAINDRWGHSFGSAALLHVAPRKVMSRSPSVKPVPSFWYCTETEGSGKVRLGAIRARAASACASEAATSGLLARA